MHHENQIGCSFKDSTEVLNLPIHAVQEEVQVYLLLPSLHLQVPHLLFQDVVTTAHVLNYVVLWIVIQSQRLHLQTKNNDQVDVLYWNI